MEANFDLQGLVKCLAEFRDGVSFHLTNETLAAPEIAEPLWKAHNVVSDALEELRRLYGFSETTIYAPEPPPSGKS